MPRSQPRRSTRTLPQRKVRSWAPSVTASNEAHGFEAQRLRERPQRDVPAGTVQRQSTQPKRGRRLPRTLWLGSFARMDPPSSRPPPKGQHSDCGPTRRRKNRGHQSCRSLCSELSLFISYCTFLAFPPSNDRSDGCTNWKYKNTGGTMNRPK